MATDLSKACWRCTYWGGFAHPQANHSLCSRLNASPLQASPATGCAYWTPGPGDGHPAGWMPPGFRLTESPVIWGKPTEPLPRPEHQVLQRPGVPSEQFAFDQAAQTAAWRATDALLSRARRASEGSD
jgi:hypothetical protein